MTRVVAIVGSYRRDGTTEAAVEAVLAGAREKGAVTQTIRLSDRHLEFCSNCRQCVQTPGHARALLPLGEERERTSIPFACRSVERARAPAIR